MFFDHVSSPCRRELWPSAEGCSPSHGKLTRGTPIDVGIGSFDVRGVAVRIVENLDHVPIGLVQNAVIRRTVEPEQILTFDDLELPESLALSAWLSTREKILQRPAKAAHR